VPVPSHYDPIRYLRAKRTVDERSFDLHVWQSLLDALASWSELAGRDAPLRVLEVGAGVGSMFERLSGILGDAVYTAVDRDGDALAAARRHLGAWASNEGYRMRGAADGAMRFRLPSGGVTLRLESADLHDVLERPAAQPGSPAAEAGLAGPWDLLVGHAVLDLLDLERSVPKLLAALAPRGLAYFPITYDGGTFFEPPIDRDYDRLVGAAYDRTMDERVVDGRLSGSSRAGRELFGHLQRAGAEVVAAGSSDWVIYPRAGGYPADEAYFLHHILEMMREALARRSELGGQRFADWIERRHDQVEAGELIYVSHQLDLLARVGLPTPDED
jgi:SAM-dependent methyltransferase